MRNKKMRERDQTMTTFLKRHLPAMTGAAMAPIRAAVEQRPMAELRN